MYSHDLKPLPGRPTTNAGAHQFFIARFKVISEILSVGLGRSSHCTSEKPPMPRSCFHLKLPSNLEKELVRKRDKTRPGNKTRALQKASPLFPAEAMTSSHA